MLLTTQEKDDWKKINNARLHVSKNYFHHHANKVLKNHVEVFGGLKDCFTSNIQIKTMIRNKKNQASKAKEYYKGIEAKDLNIRLRELLKNDSTNDIKFEVNEDRGVFYFSAEKGSIGGFDFAIINHLKNITSLRNLCFGELHYENGKKKWDDFLKNNPELIKIAEKLQNTSLKGIDIHYKYSDEHPPLVLGEIQFGNWALAYRDFFKVLKANVQNSIDCLVYVVPTGNLESLLSDGIVTYDKTLEILQSFEKVISVPVWVIGLDIDISMHQTNADKIKNLSICNKT